MSEIVPDPQEDMGLPEPQVGMGRTRVQLALISAAVPVLLAVFGLAPRLIGNDQAQADASVPAAVEASAALAPDTPKRWRIAGTVEPAAGGGPQEVALHLVPLEDAQQAQTDDQGRFVFLNVPEGVYSLLVEPLDEGERKMKITLEKQTDARVEDLRVPAPLKITITEQ